MIGRNQTNRVLKFMMDHQQRRLDTMNRIHTLIKLNDGQFRGSLMNRRLAVFLQKKDKQNYSTTESSTKPIIPVSSSTAAEHPVNMDTRNVPIDLKSESTSILSNSKPDVTIVSNGNELSTFRTRLEKMSKSLLYGTGAMGIFGVLVFVIARQLDQVESTLEDTRIGVDKLSEAIELRLSILDQKLIMLQQELEKEKSKNSELTNPKKGYLW